MQIYIKPTVVTYTAEQILKQFGISAYTFS